MKTWVLVAVAVSAMAAGAALYLARQPQATAPSTTVTPQATATDATPPARAPVEVLPQFQLADREGQLRSLADWPDKALIVNVWATWCARAAARSPCSSNSSATTPPRAFM